MVSFLVVYGTGEGQTARVATRIAALIEDQGHELTTVDVESMGDEIAVGAFDAVLVGSSIHVSSHHSGIRAFVTTQQAALRDRPTGFFQLSLSSAVDDEKRQAAAAKYVDDLLEETGWQPDRIGLFGGALRYSKYGFLKRLLMKRIARGATGDVDTARDYEYTDWDEVEAFAADFAAFVERRRGVDAPRSAKERADE